MELFIVIYFVGFLRTLVIIALIYFGIRVISRYILPILVDKGVKNMQEKANQQQRNNKQNTRPEGEVTIEYDNDGKKRTNKKRGDYIDFEEVD